MMWLRQNLVAVLFGLLVLLQCASVYLLVELLWATKRNAWVGIRNTADFAESVSDQARRRPLKVVICDSDGRECVSTSPVTIRGLGTSYLRNGIMIADPERRN